MCALSKYNETSNIMRHPFLSENLHSKSINIPCTTKSTFQASFSILPLYYTVLKFIPILIHCTWVKELLKISLPFTRYNSEGRPHCTTVELNCWIVHFEQKSCNDLANQTRHVRFNIKLVLNLFNSDIFFIEKKMCNSIVGDIPYEI